MINTKFPRNEANVTTECAAGEAREAATSATGPMFTNDDTTDNPGVASNGETLPNDCPQGSQ